MHWPRTCIQLTISAEAVEIRKRKKDREREVPTYSLTYISCLLLTAENAENREIYPECIGPF